ncbi:MAG: hypothetical protein CMF50_06985 [Legionellales bacterium]|nr:hypothetical protein [Legionellales bacterium]|tara:strand:+ start:6095 stop:7861 length:1767 start_codon:yes stop_codon:yes gene_type:complete
MIQYSQKLWRFIGYFLKPNKVYLGIILLTGLIWATEISLSPYFFKLIIDGVSQQASHPDKLLAAVLVPAVLYASMSLLLNVSFRIYDYVSMKLMIRLYTDITLAVFDYTAKHSYRFFQQNFAGSIANKLLYLPRDIDALLRSLTDNFIPKTLSVLIGSALLMLVQPIFSVILLLWVIVFVGSTCYLARTSTKNSIAFAQSVNALDGKMIDSISNIITGKIFANLPHEHDRIRGVIEQTNHKYRVVQLFNLKLHTLQGLGVTVLVAAMLTALIYCRMHELVSVGDFVFVLSLSASIIMNVWNLGQDLVNFTKNSGKCQDALSLINIAHEIAESPDVKALVVTQGEITFNHVNFAYHEGTPIFNDLSITITPGQKVGLVGFSGGGKSTFVKLILRLFDIQSGAITIDGQDIKDVYLDSLRHHIGYIPQEAELFHRTVFENIQYGRLSATKDEVITAAKQAHCHEFIEMLPEGYDALVGERGVKLSGGQRQRIAIARAMLKQAPILILDEATSALDSVTERYIQESLHDMMQGKTTIVIAHRLSTLLEMDRILLFKDGEIVEDGTLDELKRKGGLFSQLWDMQSGGYFPEL